MNAVAEIFSQGEEVIGGQVVDSNAAWLSQRMTELGFTVKRHTAVGDDLDDLSASVREIAVRADCCICSGGLGPTSDDLTAEAVGQASGLALRLDEQALRQIEAYFAVRDRPMPAINRKQAMLPETAIRIDNALGTAPGFALQIQRCWFVFLPGVPTEMRQMFDAQVADLLAQHFALQPVCRVTLRTIGIGESAIQERLEGVALPPGVGLGFRVAPDEVQTKLVFPAEFDARQKLALVEQVRHLIGDCVFAVDGLDAKQGGLVDVLDDLLREKNKTLAVLETASQGLIAAKCIGRDWLRAAEIHLAANAEAGENAALALAKQLRDRRQTDLALVQLYSATDKQSPIVLYNALSTPDATVSNQYQVAGTIWHKQNQAALSALDLLRRYLQSSCL